MPKCRNCSAHMLKLLDNLGNIFYLCPYKQVTVYTERRRGIGYIFCDVAKQQSEKLPHYMINTHESVDLQANFRSLKESFDTLAKESTLTLEKLRNATQDTVNDIKLLESANLAIMLDLPVDPLPELFNAAMRLGHAVDITTEFAIESLCKGIGRRSYFILDNIGVNMRAQQAYDWFASEHNLAATKLTDEQKRIAWQSYAIRLVQEKAEGLKVNPDKLKREQIKTHIQNQKITSGKQFLG